MRYAYRPREEEIEARRSGAMDVLAAFLLAMCVFLPVCIFWIGVWK